MSATSRQQGIVELRTYGLHPGKLEDYWRLYEREGLEIQVAILGRMLGYYSTEIGPLNQVIHLWAYRDLADRQERRARLLAHEGWQRYAAKVLPLIQTMQSQILVPAPFTVLS